MASWEDINDEIHGTAPNAPEEHDMLLPCPFCGRAVQLAGFKAPEMWVSCPTIGCKASTEAFGSAELAVAAWNRRAPDPRLEADLAAERARVEDLERALEPFAGAADARKRKDINGAVCFTQDYLLAARATLRKEQQ